MAKGKKGDGLLATVDAGELAKRLGYVNGALGRRNTLQILECVRLWARDGRLEMAVTNLDQQSETEVAADVKGAGALLVDARRLSETVARMRGELLLDATGGTLKLAAGRCRAEIPILPAADFHDMNRPDAGHTFEIASGVLAAGIGSVMHCVSKDETRPYLQGVFIQPGRGEMSFTATDGARLASLKVTSGVPDEAVFEAFILPRWALREYLKFLERADGPIQVTVDDNLLQLSGIGETHITKLLDGAFPDYERVIPKDVPTQASLPIADLKAAINAALTAALGKSRAVKFEREEGRLVCSARTEDQYCEAIVEATDIAPGPDFGVNGVFLLEALDALRGDAVDLGFNDPASPILITNGDKLRQVVMPLRV